MSNATLNLLCDLIAIDSVNPSLVDGGAGERQIADFLAHHIKAAGLEVEVMEVAPGRPNVIGVLEGRSPGRTLMYCGHTDTVGVGGMAAPFTPELREGRVYGRGSLDMKGGVAAMIGAAKTVAMNGGLPAGKLIVAAVADEECKSIGADHLVRSWHADAAVVTEPTDLEIAIAHKGFTWIEVILEGFAAHGSQPSIGRDAILLMGKFLNRLEILASELRSRAPHPLLGSPSLHASTIAGGRELSTYPDRCCLQMERRIVAGEEKGTALIEVERILSDLKKDDPEFIGSARVMFERQPSEIPADHELPLELQTVLARIGRKASHVGMGAWADAAILSAAGIPTVLFGPGGVGLHALVEYVLVDDVLMCQKALTELARSFCLPA